MTDKDNETSDRIRIGLSAVIASADPTLAERLESDAESHLELIDLASRCSAEAAGLLQSAVASARLAEVSWGKIGRQLGMSRQAAQQRFGRRV
jgi:hypothetical protein